MREFVKIGRTRDGALRYPERWVVKEPVVTTEKKDKIKQIDSLKIEHNTVLYDSDEASLLKMGLVVGVANYKALNSMYMISKEYISNKLLELSNGIITQNELDSDVMYNYSELVVSNYEAIYKSKINWKGADNLVHQVQIESICETVELSMLEISNILKIVQ